MPAADASQHAAALAFAAPQPGRISTINRFTGLSTDYLNHFTEALMVLEMGAMMSDCLDDLRGWTPKTYREHFVASRFNDRDAVLAAYEAAEPAVRAALDDVAQRLNSALAAIRDRVLADAGGAADFTKTSLAIVKPLITHAAAIINGADAGGSQASVDAMMSR
jgi:hypothetical protein